LAPRAEILEAYLFGSRARGDAHFQSDVDVAVYIDEARAEAGPFGYQADLTTHLMAALGTNEIDVVVLNKAPILLYHRVLRDGVRLLSRDLRATTTRAGQALSRYFDFLPQMEKMDAARRFAAGEDRR
jgi:predicted nucleotidyltransferase